MRTYLRGSLQCVAAPQGTNLTDFVVIFSPFDASKHIKIHDTNLKQK
jgi:hypothetical protein